MATRNFYLEAHVDGQKTPLKGGPASKTGGLVIQIYQRHEGRIVQAFKISCGARGCDLETVIERFDRNKSEIVSTFTTIR